MIEKEAQGQAGSVPVLKLPGFPVGLSGGSGPAVTQARQFGVEIITPQSDGVRLDDPYRLSRWRMGRDQLSR